MTNPTLLSDPQEVIGKQWSQDSSPERAQVLGLARDALGFISATGQRYQFEDLRESLGTMAVPPSAPRALWERLNSTEGFFTKLRDQSASDEERGLIQVILDALRFISSTDQFTAFGDYLEHVEAGAPPYVVASFETMDAAESWLKNHPNPPVSANVLIANEYHDVVYDRATGRRRLPRNRDLEYYLAELRREESPIAVASFESLGGASEWLRLQPRPARWAWVLIDGEFYLAVYHPNIGHRALYPLSLARGDEG